MRLLSIKSLLVAASIVLAVYFLDPTGYVSADAFNPYNPALDHLARAETAQTPAEVIEHVRAGKAELSKIGYVSWWSTEKVEYESVLSDLDKSAARAEEISALDSQNPMFISEMFAIHDTLELMRQSLRF